MKIPDRQKVLKEIAKLHFKKGMGIYSLVGYLKDKYGVGNPWAYTLIKEMRVQVGDAMKETNENILEDTVTIIEEMREKALKNNDIKTALKAQEEINKILQLHQQNIKINLESEQPLLTPINKEDKEDKEDTK